MSEFQRKLLQQHLEQVQLVERQMEEPGKLTGQAMRRHSDTVRRLTAIPGVRILAAQQIIAEAGPGASTFASPEKFSSWIGACPGRKESAEENRSTRCPRGNACMRRILCQAAQAAVKTKNSIFQQKFQRLVPRLGFIKSIWAIARHLSVVIWKVLHESAEYIEKGGATSAGAAKRRLQRLRKEYREMGFEIQLLPIESAHNGAPAA